MRRLISLCVLAIALAVPAVGYAVAGGSDDGTLSVKNGIGRVYVSINGSIVGRLGGKASIKVVDPNPNDGFGPEFLGCDAMTRDRSTSTTYCQTDGKGSVVRFRAIGGNYGILIRGHGIFLSAVGHGYATLNGWANDDPTIDADGTYSVNDGPYKSLPDYGGTVQLAAPPGG